MAVATMAGMVLLALAGAAAQPSYGLPDPEGAPQEANLEDAEFVPGQVLVRFRPGAARNEIAEANRARPREQLLLQRLWVLDVEPGEELEVTARLRQNPNVELAEPNYVYSVVPCETGDCTAPSDPQFGAKWDLHNTGFVTDAAGGVVAATGEAGSDISWLETFEYLQGSDVARSDTVIAVIDTGIRAAHQDLAGKVIGGRNFCPSILCLIGTPNPAAWADDNGHGTHVSGIAAGRANDALGVPGVAYPDEVKLLAVKVCGTALGLCNAAGVANGIIWAVDNGAHVLNLSLGGGAASAAQQAALQYALDNNVLPVCASGNDGAATVSFPAAFPQCMAVGSTNWSDQRASYSNFGPQIEIAAPGGDVSDSQPHSFILSSWFTANNAYAYAAGTSMAAPQVSGLAALLRATGLESSVDVRERIRTTADDLGSAGWDPEFGDGRINVYRALTQLDPVIEMTISARNVVNLSSQGMLQVVLLERDALTFGLDMLDLASVRLGGVGLATRPSGSPFATWSDVDGDGLADLVLHFSIPELTASGALTAATTQLTLKGTLGDGRRLQATAPVRAR